MENSSHTVNEALDLLKVHTKHWDTDQDLELRTDIFRQVLERLQHEIGLENAQLILGLASHNVDVLDGQDGFEREPENMNADAINMYSLLLVTPRVIIEAHGHIQRDPTRIGPEPTVLWARRRVSQVIMNLETGDLRASGVASSHPDLTLRFEDGRSLPFPGWEDELSESGIAALEGVIHVIKQEVFS